MFVFFFVGLVFLLAATQIRPHALYIELPFHDKAAPTPPDSYTIHTVSITKQDQLLFDDKAVAPSELISLLALFENDRSARLVFEPDGMASYNHSVKTLAIIARAGWANGRFCIEGLEEHRNFSSGRKGVPMPFFHSIYIDPEIMGAEVFGTALEFESCDPAQLNMMPRF